MAVPYTFGSATTSIPLSQLDSNFATTITLGNTAIQLGNTVTTLNNMTMANVTVSSGVVTASNVTVTGSTVPANGIYLPTTNTLAGASNSTKVYSVLQGSSFALEGATPQTGTGISFPATQSASSDANTLDDYEEGTFTPVPRFSGNNVGMTGTFLGKYTKIGNLVIAQVYFAINNKGSSTGNLSVGGLPFNTATYGGPGGYYSTSFYVQNGQVTGLSGKWLTPNVNGAGIDINYSDQTNGSDAACNQGNIGTTGAVWITCSYLTT